MKVLIIGGTGTISSYVVKKCLEKQMDVTILNRGNSSTNEKNLKTIIADITDESDVREKLANQSFDSVIQFVAYDTTQIEKDMRIFKDKTKQYIFISTASAYQKPLSTYPITEDTPLKNPYWEYSRNKIACEKYLSTVKDLPITIVRPSHTYDNHKIMTIVKRDGYEYAHIARLEANKPVIIPGDGTSLWTITHALDFANSFVELIGNEAAFSETFHITSNKIYTWEELTNIIAKKLGVQAKIIHIPTDYIIKYFPELKGPLLGDKTWSAVFDNSKIKSITKKYTSKIGYEDVVEEAIKHYQANKDLQRVDFEFERIYDQLVEDFLAK